MTLKMLTNKKGAYLLEATISLPIFIIAVIVMNSIILMYSCIEDANCILATELRRGAAEAIQTNTSVLIPARILDRTSGNHSQINSLKISDYVYRQSAYGQDELIGLKIKMELTTNNPLNLAANANYDLSLITRAYVGKVRDVGNMTADEMMNKSEAVYIFPKRGEKYHTEGCSVLHAAYKSAVLNNSIKSTYSSCPLCHSSRAQIGATVYYFPVDGEDYHLPGCSCMERNYIEIEKAVAIERGYTPCSKCGG